jgi:oxygen-independent coproporphyrinogen-3 oxidase
MEDWRAGGFGLYIHWPFCQSKCPYCDFNSHVAATIDQRRWRDAYLREIARVGAETPGRVLETVFFGGGTPSLMEPEVVADVLAAVRATWPMVNDPEITLEANPGSVEAGRFQGFADAGVNRVSMGVQALRDEDLRRLGRLHSVGEARQAFDIARKFFNRVSFDLIYARQDQTLADWRSELHEALSMAVDHLSMYQLTIEEGTAFGDRFARGGLRGLPDEDVQADMYAVTQEVCAAHGMPAYEVSNHARAGAESRHNLIYWRMGDYIGIGPGAHGRLTLDGHRWATVAPKAPGAWLAMAESGPAVEEPREEVLKDEQALEYLLMSMRLSEGMDVARYERLAGRPLDSGRLEGLAELGLVRADSGRLMATAEGRPLLNGILRELAK